MHPIWVYIFTLTAHAKICSTSAREALNQAPEGKIVKVTYVNMTTPELESYWASMEI